HREIERAQRYDQPLSLLAIDVDDLKRINDEGGHLVGDKALQLIARVLKGTVRTFDLVARQGGDEFAVLLPNTAAREALVLAERLRSEIVRQLILGRPLSASIGVAAHERGMSPLTVRSLVEASDQALYRAERGVRRGPQHVSDLSAVVLDQAHAVDHYVVNEPVRARLCHDVVEPDIRTVFGSNHGANERDPPARAHLFTDKVNGRRPIPWQF